MKFLKAISDFFGIIALIIIVLFVMSVGIVLGFSFEYFYEQFMDFFY